MSNSLPSVLFITIGAIGLVGGLPSIQAANANPPDCSAVNLYEASDSPLHRIPIYDQGEMNTCYAYTASQMVDYYRFKNSPTSTELTSPIWTALIHKIHVPLHWSPDSLDFSRMTWVFKDLEKYGICDQAVMDRAIENLKNGNPLLTESDVMFFFQSLWDAYQSEKGQKFTTRGREKNYLLAYEKVAGNPYFSPKIQYSLADKFHWISYGKEGERLDSLLNEVFSECTGSHLERIQLPKRASIGPGFASDKKIIRGIQTVLNDAEPVGLGYCSTVLTAPSGYRGIKIKPRILGMAINDSDCGSHYSIVVGKRPSPRGCEFLIRNSYGPGFWTDRLDCYCETTDKIVAEYLPCHASETVTKALRVLGCWIGAADLAANTFDVTHFR